MHTMHNHHIITLEISYIIKQDLLLAAMQLPKTQNNLTLILQTKQHAVE